MEEATLKEDLIDKIEHADHKQLREIYGLITNYFNENEDEEGWDSLTEFHKEKITKSIAEGEAGLGTPASEVIKQARKKYGLNG
ncbi:MAG: hypothetical protein JWR50_3856 [Mucilaginibacter sp.]|nr:hypothetical protein [Mucilaginibacter sp.]